MIKTEESVILRRRFGLTTCCSMIVGSIIGSGIFVSPQGVVIGAGSYGLSLVIWALCGLLSLCCALVYTEMGLLIPKSGSAFYYIKEIYGDCAAFVYMFAHIFCIVPGSNAAVALTCAEYFLSLFFNDGCGTPPDHIKKIIAVILILLGGVINIRSVAVTGKISVIFTAAKLAALAVIILGGIVKLALGYSDYLHPDNSFDGTNPNAGGIATAFISGMYAYGGWAALTSVTEEIKNPSQNLPWANFISIPLVTIVYLLTNISYFAVIPPAEIKESLAVALTWANYVMPSVWWFVSLAVTLSTFGSTCTSQLLSTRLTFVASREGHLPGVISMVHVKYLSPAPAVIVMTILSALFVYMGSVGELIQFTSILDWVFTGMVGAGLLKLRLTHKHVHRVYKAPLVCPFVLIFFAIFLFLGPIISNPQLGNLFAIIVIIVAIIIWLFVIKWSCPIPELAQLTQTLQLLLQVSPTSKMSAESDLDLHKTAHIKDNKKRNDIKDNLFSNRQEFTKL